VFAGLLPESGGHTEVNRLRFADHAVPELTSRVVALGARLPMLEAILIGGASMLAAIGGPMEVGARGRTVRVDPKTGIVLVREAGGKDTQLYPATASKLPTRTLEEGVPTSADSAIAAVDHDRPARSSF
jgi:chemotaxis receptor (MCP) glutamine deamidase CheD